jgi:hypothetical protein
LPEYRRTEGLAVWSLTLAMVGAFVPPITISAIVLGVLSLKRIGANPQKLDGANHARAGIVLGAVFTFLASVLYMSPTVFTLDGVLRDLALGGRLNYVVDDPVAGNDVEIIRPPRSPKDWGKFNSSQQPQTGVLIDPLILINTRDDACLAILDLEGMQLAAQNDDAVREKVIERIKKSELINLLNRVNRGPAPDIAVVEKRAIDPTRNELILDVRLGGIDRRLLVQYSTPRNRGFILVGCARKAWFEYFRDDFIEAFKKFKDKS